MGQDYDQGSKSLAQTFERAKTAVMGGSKYTIACIGAEPIDLSGYSDDTGRVSFLYWSDNSKRYKPDEGDLVSFAHSFFMAVGIEGVRIFMSCGFHPKIPYYTLPQYNARDGPRLRSWDEAKELLTTL